MAVFNSNQVFKYLLIYQYLQGSPVINCRVRRFRCNKYENTETPAPVMLQSGGYIFGETEDEL
jgi:hypothetical protein